MAGKAAIPLEVITHQHDLILDVILDIRELVRQGTVAKDQRSAFFSRVALLAEFVAEHSFIEQSEFFPPIRAHVQHAKRPEVLQRLDRIEQRIEQLGAYAERVLDLCCEPSAKRVQAAGGIPAVLRFVNVAERMIRREDENVIPFVERLLGRKSRRLTRRDDTARPSKPNAGATGASTATTSHTDEEPPPATRRDMLPSA